MDWWLDQALLIKELACHSYDDTGSGVLAYQEEI